MSERCYVCGRVAPEAIDNPYRKGEYIDLCPECSDRRGGYLDSHWPYLVTVDLPNLDKEWLSKQTFYKDRVLLEDLSVGMWYWFHCPLLLPSLEIVVDMLPGTPYWIKVQFVSIKGVSDSVFKVSTYGRGLGPRPVPSGGEWGKGRWCQRYSSTLMPEDKPGDKTGAKSVAKSGCKLGDGSNE